MLNLRQEKQENKQFESACGYQYSIILIAWKRIRSCILMPEGSLKDLSQMPNRKPATSHIFMKSILLHKRKMIQ